jgi:hypothetical protein
MLAMELPYGERDRTAPVDHYASIFPYAAPSSVVVEGSSIAARQRSGVWSAPFKDKKKKDIIGRSSTSPPPGEEQLDDTATITTQVFKAKLDQLSSFRQLSQDERQQLLLDVKKLLGGDTDTTTKKKSSNYDHHQRSTSGRNKTSTTDVYEDGSTMFSTDEESQTQFTLDETQFGDQTQFTINDETTRFTMSNEDDQETQFSTDSQSLLSLIDNVFARNSHYDNNNERRGESGTYNRRRRRERTASWSHGGSVDYDDVEENDGGGENCMLSMCDSFLSCLICDGKSDAVDMAAREQRKEYHRSRGGSGSRKGSRERKHDTRTDEHRHIVPVAYRESSFIMDESVIYSDDSNHGGSTTVSDNSTTVHDQQSSLLSGWTETTTSPDKVDPSSGVRTALMSMEDKQQLVTVHKEVDNTAKVEERDLQQDVVLVDDSVGVVVNEGTKKESYGDNIIVDSNNHVTTARVSSPTESIDDIISQTEQLSSGKISLREDSAPTTLDGGKTSSSSVIVPKKPWKEYTDRTTGLKYYSNGVITTWDRPDDSCNIIVASPSMSAIKSQLKNEQKQLQLDSMAAMKNGPFFKSIRERVGIKSFFKRK